MEKCIEDFTHFSQVFMKALFRLFGLFSRPQFGSGFTFEKSKMKSSVVLASWNETRSNPQNLSKKEPIRKEPCDGILKKL